MMESGNHFLQSLQSTDLHFGQYSNRINSFIMNAEHSGAKIIRITPPRESFYNSIIFYAQYIQINGITFVGSLHITVINAQEVMINNCSFQGVSFGLLQVTIAVFSRCTFADYQLYDQNRYYGQHGALSILHSTSVSIVQSNFTNNDVALYRHNYYSRRVLSLHIQDSMFSNNTYSEFEGGALHFAGDSHASVSVDRTIFFNNTSSQSGGAIYLDVEHLNLSVTESRFIQNSADSCGVLNIHTRYNSSIVQITDTTFDSNEALRASDTGGGAICVVTTSAVISNCTFVGNTAAGSGGAFVSHNSTVVINHTVFQSNTAGSDGGVLISYAHPSNYTITQSIFTNNQAGDDGGAIFIGHRGSYVTLDMCSFSYNHASDRGGAITIFGSTLEITETSIENNSAALGDTFSSCNSNVMTSLYGHRDMNCSYDGPITSHSNTTTLLKCRDFTNITLDVTIGEFCSEREPSEPTTREVNKVTTAAYVSLTISAIVVIAFLLYLLIEKLVRSKIKCMKWPITSTVFTPATQLQSEPLYAEATAQANDSAEAIEMKPNVLYGKCEQQN